MTEHRTAWRARAGLFAVLGGLLLVNGAVLVTYDLFFDVRIQALSESRRELEARRDAARAAAAKVKENERRLGKLQEELDGFFSTTLGTRRERLAPLIEDVHAITRKAGFAPDSFQYNEGAEVPGAERIAVAFRVEGRYAEIKRLLAAFESNPRFLILERVEVGSGDAEPDLLKVGLVVAHYFRSETARPVRRPSRSGAPAAERGGAR